LIKKVDVTKDSLNFGREFGKEQKNSGGKLQKLLAVFW
jgi:hypothetical protein